MYGRSGSRPSCTLGSHQGSRGNVPARDAPGAPASAAHAFRELLQLAGYYLPWAESDLTSFDELLRSYRRLPLIDQLAVRERLLWHVLGLGSGLRTATERS